MTAAVRKAEPITVEAFLAALDRCPPTERWSLVDGEIVRMMAGGTRRHATITMNVGTALRTAVRPRGCTTLLDMFVRGPESDATLVAPDVLVTCGAGSGIDRTVDDPVVVVEVLSPSTMAFDRGRKFAFYETLPTLRHIVLVYQDQMRVEVWSRGEEAWAYELATAPGDALRLAAVDAAVALAEIYDGVAFTGVAA